MMNRGGRADARNRYNSLTICISAPDVFCFNIIGLSLARPVFHHPIFRSATLARAKRNGELNPPSRVIAVNINRDGLFYVAILDFRWTSLPARCKIDLSRLCSGFIVEVAYKLYIRTRGRTPDHKLYCRDVLARWSYVET